MEGRKDFWMVADGGKMPKNEQILGPKRRKGGMDGLMDRKDIWEWI
jgi:hypothetical protein